LLTCGAATSPLIAQVAQRDAIEGIGEAWDGDSIIVDKRIAANLLRRSHA
jgi:hypothetical protein